MKQDYPEICGRYVLLRVGKKFDARRLREGLEKCLRSFGSSLNSEQRVPMVSLLAQITNHLERPKVELSPAKVSQTEILELLDFIGGGSEGIACRKHTGEQGEDVYETDDAHKIAREMAKRMRGGDA